MWLSQKLAEQVAILEEHPEVAMVYGRAQFWYSWTGRPKESRRDYFMDLGVLPDTYDEYFFNWAEKYLIDQGQKDTEI